MINNKSGNEENIQESKEIDTVLEGECWGGVKLPFYFDHLLQLHEFS